jgi:hypothetical protein
MLTELHTPHDHTIDQTAPELRESAYRRGFQHGLQYILDFLDDGASLSDVHKYAIEVAHWRERTGRFKSRRERLCRPPVPQRG